MAWIGRIAVSAATFAIDKPFSYRIPPDMTLAPGQRVVVPFGKGNRHVEGIVLSVEEGSPDGLKAVERPLEEEPLFTPEQLRLAAFVRERYFCTFFDAARAMLPAGVWFREETAFSLTEDQSWREKAPKSKDALAVLNLVDSLGGSCAEAPVEAILPDEGARAKALAYLTKKKWLTAQREYLRRLGDKSERVAVLAVPAEEALAYAESRPRSARQQREILRLLSSLGEASVKDLCYYTGASAKSFARLEKLGFLTLTHRPVLRCREITPARLDGPQTLNAEQRSAYDGLRQKLESDTPGTAVLWGVTGSGKTAVYIALIRRCLALGKSALLLVPEIALTPQLLSLLAAHFGPQVGVLHSSLSVGERRDQWLRVRRGEAKVVVGTRSAVFAPCRPGLIILDEEQEHSYRSENVPRYAAQEVAIVRGMREGALVLLGSATPSIETMYHARQGRYSLFTLPRRYNGRPLPQVQIVDMGQELRSGNGTSLSRELRQALAQTFDAGQQAILLLNRRGNSRCLVCVDCGKAPECPRCGLRLTYHSANSRLMCHYCGYSIAAPERCPTCGGPLKPIGTGTQRVQEELAEIFPDIPTLRMDTDTVSAVNTHEKLLERFQAEHIPVLIGTQMVAKGLNLPGVTLVGVLDADLSLYAGGYRAGETTFNLLTQVVGRAGRGDTPGRAILQTMAPGNQIIRLAAEQNYEGFYDLELRLRQAQNAPPFGDIALIVLTGQEEAVVLRSGAKLRDSLRQILRGPSWQGMGLTVLGPAPCPVPKINYRFRYQLTLRGHLGKELRGLLAYLLREFSADRQTRGVTAFIDINGYE